MVIILRGVSGAGKSTWIRENFAKEIVRDIVWENMDPSYIVGGKGKSRPNVVVYSADHFFLDKEGNYIFDGSKLPLAHGTCLRKFALSMLEPDPKQQTHIVDNTNTSVAEIAPYAALALAYGHELKLVTLHIDPAIAAERNVHGAPAEAVAGQAKRLLAADLMPWWPNEDVVVGTLDRASLIHLALKHVKAQVFADEDTQPNIWKKARAKAQELGASDPDYIANEVMLRIESNVAIA